MLPRLIAIFLFSIALQAATPIRLHPNNPHYFEWRGKPTIFLTAGEHYGAAINADFDFTRYLDELQKHNFNLTRVFSGAYREVPGSFNITDNTLAPPPEKFLCPWPRAGEQFDLTKWNDAYFTRLKNLLTAASNRGIVVELVLFCTMYDDSVWNASPMNVRNNINNVGNVSRYEVYNAADKNLLAIQTSLARKFATELNAFENLYFEICNEPYERGGLTKEWNDQIVAAIVEAEATLPNQHLIAQGFPRDEAIPALNPHISVLNFHAATPISIRLNHHLNRPLALDETGGSDRADRKYRTEGWDFILAGGAVYDHLDFSFTTSKPDGSLFPLPENTPGGGGPQLRRQLAILKRFIESLDFLQMKPADHLLKSSPSKNHTIRILAQPGQTYAIYIHGDGPIQFDLELSPANYTAEWLNPKAGAIEKTVSLTATATPAKIQSPPFSEDIALKISRR